MAEVFTGVCSTGVKVACVAEKLYDRLVQLKFNDKEIDELLSSIQELLRILRELEKTTNYSRDIQSVLEKVKRNLDYCEKTCIGIDEQSFVKKFVRVHGHGKEVSALKEWVQTSLTLANTCLVATNAKGIQRIERKLDRSLASQPGLYPESGSALKPPGKVEKLMCQCRGPNELSIKWTDKFNPPGGVSYYEIQHDEHEHYLRVPPMQGEPLATACIIERDKTLGPGPTYSIRVRGVNSCGPGEWSEAFVCRFKHNLPETPTLLDIFQVVSSANCSVTLIIGKPSERKTTVLVEYIDSNGTEWCQEKFPTEDLPPENFDGTKAVKIVLQNWRPDTEYSLRIKLINQSGESKPCATVHITTQSIAPGKPTELRVSSLRTTKLLKIRWKEPEINAHVVHHYEIQWGRNRRFDKIKTTKKLSAKFTGLKSNTKHGFCVRAVSKKGRSSPFTEEIMAETRMKGARKAKAIAGGVGAGVLGTLLSPVAGVVGGYMLASDATKEDLEEKTESKGAKQAAGAAAGIAGGAGLGALMVVGAPVAGVAVGIVAGKMIMEVDLSPQTSDDDDDDNERVSDPDEYDTDTNEEDEKEEEDHEEYMYYAEDEESDNSTLPPENERPDNSTPSITRFNQPVYMNELQSRLSTLGRKS